MDVRCERCKTEYEFDDARITEAGVTVKCTTCSHVFKVKKKALVVTVPVKPDDADGANASPLGNAIGSGAGDAKEKPKEWKVRQASGNVFTFKELTTLQKWIVERKVTREDEISLTGETWKRLGNIAELASFFQVVDDAQKAVQLSALQNLGLGAPLQTPGSGYTLPVPSAAPPPLAPSPLPQATSLAPPLQPGTTVAPSPSSPGIPTGGAPRLSNADAAQPVPLQAKPAAAHVTHFPPAPRPADPPAEDGPAPTADHPPEPPTPVAPGPSAPLPAAVDTPAALPPSAAPSSKVRSAARSESRRGGNGWVVALLVLAALGGGGYWAYSQGHLPMVDALLARARGAGGLIPVTPPTPADGPSAEAVPQPDAGTAAAGLDTPPPDEADAGLPAAEAVLPDAGALSDDTATSTSPIDAGTPAAVTVSDAGTGTAVSAPNEARKRPEPVRDFDYYMALGDRMRERERAEAAMDAYGKAVDLQPRRAEPYAGRGLALLDMGATLQAEAAFQQALKLNPRYGVAVMGLAEAYRAQGKKDEAIRYYRRYLEILPNGPEAPVARGAIERLGN